MASYKLGSFPDDGKPLRYANTFATQKTTGPDRLIIAPESHYIDILLSLAQTLPEPFGLLYVLLSPPGKAPGRYQSPQPSSLEETEYFLQHFQLYLESDGRHHIWLVSLPTSSTLVYDNHNVIYAYGPLSQFREKLLQLKFTEDATSIPYPHMHLYDAKFNSSEREVMNYWAWQKFPLLDSDDDM
jgi:hypothetical protein